MTIAPLAVVPAAAAQAYASVDNGFSAPGTMTGAATDFSATLQRAMESAVTSGHQADSQATQAIAGHGSVTDVVTAVSKAELALQTTVALRDRMVQAYSDIMKMPI